MRILQVGKYYWPVKGGMETVLRHTCEGLLAAGHQVTALVAGEDPLDRSQDLPAPSGASPGRLLRAGRVAVLWSQPLTPGLPALLRRELAGASADVVQLHLPNPGACAAWLAVAGAAAPPLAIWYHADITRQRLGLRLVRPLVERCLERAAGIAVSSLSLADSSPWLRRHRAKVRVIPFGIDPGPPPEPQAGADAPFLFVGRLVYYKGIAELLEAVARVPAARLVVVGAGPLLTAARERARAGDLAGRVELPGEVDEAGLRGLMRRARALVLPSVSRSETFGLVQLEAMAAGLPVVSSALPTGVAEVNRDGETGRVVAPGDVGALAAALRELLDDPDRGRAWGRAGRRRVERLYGRDRMVADLLAWYRELAAGSGPRGRGL